MSNANSQQVTVEQAYDEACRALGEALTQQRLIAKSASSQIELLKQDNEKLSYALEGAAKTCVWCSQIVTDESSHSLWHQQNDLHAASCEYLQSRKLGATQRAKKPCVCTCGVRDWSPDT